MYVKETTVYFSRIEPKSSILI